VVASAASVVAVAVAAAAPAVFRRRCHFLSICSASVYEYLCNVGGVFLTGENGSMPRKGCTIATVPVTKPTCSGLELNSWLSIEKPATNRLSHGVT
jgi:hypothetical protein